MLSMGQLCRICLVEGKKKIKNQRNRLYFSVVVEGNDNQLVISDLTAAEWTVSGGWRK